MLFRLIAPALLIGILFVAPATLAADGAPADNVKRGAPVGLGDMAPDFTLEDQDGRAVKLSAEWKVRPVVLIFYRGHWCPYCTRQFAELRTLLRPNEQVSVLAVSIDAHEQSKEFSNKIAADGKGPLTFAMLSDPGHRTIDLYGLQDPQYLKLKLEGIPYPTTYVIDRTGRIAWTRLDRNYRERPPTAEVRAAIDALR